MNRRQHAAALIDFGAARPPIIPSERYLTDAHNMAVGVTTQYLYENSAQWTSTVGRGHVSWANVPSGTRIRFTLTYTGSVWWRHANDVTLQANIASAYNFTGSGTVNIDYIVQGQQADRAYMGWVTNSSGTQITISNFRVSPPSIIFLTNPHNLNGGLAETNLTPTGADYATTGGGNSSFSFPKPPVGSRVRVSIYTNGADVVWRHASNSALTGTVQDKYRSVTGENTFNLDYTVLESDGQFYGIITAHHPRVFRVRDFLVTAAP